MWNGISVWIWLPSLMICDVEYFFMSLLAIYTSSLEKCLFRFCIHFLFGLFDFSYWVVEILYILWAAISYHKHNLRIFPCFIGCHFTLPLCLTEAFMFDTVSFVSFESSCCLGFWCIVKKSLPNPVSWRFCHMFINSCIVLGKFRTLIHF